MTDHVPFGIPEQPMRGAVNKTSEFVLVPRKLTDQMYVAFREALDDNGHIYRFTEAYEAMLDAAPEPQPEVAADLIERCAAQIEPALWPMLDEHDRNLHRAIAKRILALATPPVVEEAVKAEREANIKIAYSFWNVGGSSSKLVERIVAAIRARSATP